MNESILLSSVVIGFSLIVAAVAFGSAVGDGIVSSKAVEAIARQPEARPNIFTFMFLGVGVLEAFPIIALGLGLYLFFVVSGAPAGIPQVLKSLAGH
ncbi:MAG: ATP synthase F0 subunit C [Vulcanimicrobiaceae bacterium]